MLRKKVVSQIVASYCSPIIINESEACCLKQFDVCTLDFAFNPFLIKLSETAYVNVIQNFLLPFYLIKTVVMI